METIEEAIRRLIKDEYGSVPKFAKAINLPASSIYSSLDRGIANTRTELSDRIYRALNIDWETAKLGDDYKCLKLKASAPNSAMTEVPLYGSIAAGIPIEMVEVEDTKPIPNEVHTRYPEAFLLKVEGESMNKSLPNGCYALVDPCSTVERDGMPYAVCINGFNATIKRVRKLNNGFVLEPDSDDTTYEPKVFNFNDPDTMSVTVIGRVVYYVLPTDWEF